MTKNYDDRFPYEQAWLGVRDPSLLADEMVAAGHQLADAAKQGDWSTVFTLLGQSHRTIPVSTGGDPAERRGSPSCIKPPGTGFPPTLRLNSFGSARCALSPTPTGARRTRCAWTRISTRVRRKPFCYRTRRLRCAACSDRRRHC